MCLTMVIVAREDSISMHPRRGELSLPLRMGRRGVELRRGVCVGM